MLEFKCEGGKNKSLDCHPWDVPLRGNRRVLISREAWNNRRGIWTAEWHVDDSTLPSPKASWNLTWLQASFPWRGRTDIISKESRPTRAGWSPVCRKDYTRQTTALPERPCHQNSLWRNGATSTTSKLNCSNMLIDCRQNIWKLTQTDKPKSI